MTEQATPVDAAAERQAAMDRLTDAMDAAMAEAFTSAPGGQTRAAAEVALDYLRQHEADRDWLGFSPTQWAYDQACEALHRHEARAAVGQELAAWLVSLDDPDPASDGFQERRQVTLTAIIQRAEKALRQIDRAPGERLPCGCPSKPTVMYQHVRGCTKEAGDDWWYGP